MAGSPGALNASSTWRQIESRDGKFAEKITFTATALAATSSQLLQFHAHVQRLSSIMGNIYLLNLQPTFTQGLVLGQLSVLILLGLILKYLFLDSTHYPFETSTYHPRAGTDVTLKRGWSNMPQTEDQSPEKGSESAEWFSTILKQVYATILALGVIVISRCTGAGRLSLQAARRLARRRGR